MKADEKQKLFENELNARIKDLSHKRRWNKNVAFSLKIMAVFFAALITVLLGLKVDDNWAKLFQGIALVLGATITVVNAVEAFYDHRSLWIRQTITLTRLYDLKIDLDFYLAGLEQAEIDVKMLSGLRERYTRILQDDLKAWLKLREAEPLANKPQVATAPKKGE